MYMPYLRGKQFELLALRDLADVLGTTGNVSPVIEPVRMRGDALVRCLDALSMSGVTSTVVLNPSVGEFAASPSAAADVLELLSTCNPTQRIRPGVLVHGSTNVSVIRESLEHSHLAGRSVDLIHEEYVGDNGLHNIVDERSRQLVPSQQMLRRYEAPLPGQRIRLNDEFPRRDTNLAYVGAEPSLFTDAHLYYRDDGFDGFGDFTTIGRWYSEGGSSPRAVVIHLTYPEPRGIWIRHFSSDSNEDTADPAGKFGEALAKLVTFADSVDLNNPAIDAFRRYAADGAYPGLGMVKKLSIQNHLYVMEEALNR